MKEGKKYSMIVNNVHLGNTINLLAAQPAPFDANFRTATLRYNSCGHFEHMPVHNGECVIA